jgi:hypothetical protein
MEETVGFRQVMCFVMLESAEDRVLGVDTPEQQVFSCGTATTLGKRGRGTATTPGNIRNAMVLCTTLAKHGI